MCYVCMLITCLYHKLCKSSQVRKHIIVTDYVTIIQAINSTSSTNSLIRNRWIILQLCNPIDFTPPTNMLFTATCVLNNGIDWVTEILFKW